MITSHRSKVCILIFALAFVFYALDTNAQARDTLFYENWESGIGLWFASNGVWEVGVDTSCIRAHSGTKAAGTVLNGAYPPNANSRLTSTLISLPPVSASQSLKLRYWQWVSSENGYDGGRVHISIDTGRTWQTISDPLVDGSGVVWSQNILDLTRYAGSSIRLGFLFTSDNAFQYCGWYLDDISIERGSFPLVSPNGFELGINDWAADNGLWEAGRPTVGPPSAYSGNNCVATVLHGNYTPYANTRLISVPFRVIQSGSQIPRICFWHWFSSENGYDGGYLQISVSGRPWQTVSNFFTGSSGGWSQYCYDLFSFRDSTIRLGFYFVSDNAFEYSGWYIDSISLQGITSGISGREISPPRVFELSQNYPNPFNPETKIKFQICTGSDVSLMVYDVLGREVKTLVSERLQPGSYETTFDGSGLASGVYLYRLQAGGFVETKKLILLQ